MLWYGVDYILQFAENILEARKFAFRKKQKLSKDLKNDTTILNIFIAY